MEPLRCTNCRTLQRQVEDLQAENERLRGQLETARRAGKRQAGPFAKGEPKANPKRPGRKPGQDYGTKAHRQPPAPEQIDEVHEAPLPTACPDCGRTARRNARGQAIPGRDPPQAPAPAVLTSTSASAVNATGGFRDA